MCPNYGRVDLVFDYSVSLLERHLSLVRSLQFDFSSICFCRFVFNRVRACGDLEAGIMKSDKSGHYEK